MQISEFDFELPSELIAREPMQPRDASRMMVLDSAGKTSDSSFRIFPEFLNSTDVLVLNDTKVIRARTTARLERRAGTSREIEIFFAEPQGERPETSGRFYVNRDDVFDREIVQYSGPGNWAECFESVGGDLHTLELDSPESITEILERFGQVPLPPYIERPENPADEENYQTVFAAHSGAVAAPTAGLHFTGDVLAAVRARGVSIVSITLHVGIGTFLPVRTDQVENHVLRAERFDISESTAEVLRAAYCNKQRVVAVGTTTTRTLEFLMREYGEIRAGAGKTDLYILPGFQFRIVGALLTNFHLPKSTLLMLVSAFGGCEEIRRAYRHAIEARYRFYSYGDCMFIQK